MVSFSLFQKRDLNLSDNFEVTVSCDKKTIARFNKDTFTTLYNNGCLSKTFVNAVLAKTEESPDTQISLEGVAGALERSLSSDMRFKLSKEGQVSALGAMRTNKLDDIDAFRLSDMITSSIFSSGFTRKIFKTASDARYLQLKEGQWAARGDDLGTVTASRKCKDVDVMVTMPRDTVASLPLFF